jgi:hypothetical protein
VSFFGMTDTPDSPDRRPADVDSRRRPAQRRSDDGGLSVTLLKPEILIRSDQPDVRRLPY